MFVGHPVYTYTYIYSMYLLFRYAFTFSTSLFPFREPSSFQNTISFNVRRVCFDKACALYARNIIYLILFRFPVTIFIYKIPYTYTMRHVRIYRIIKAIVNTYTYIRGRRT